MGEAFPEVPILDLFLGRGDPAVPLPSGYPFGDALDEVFGIGVHRRLEEAFVAEAAQGVESGRHLHPIVGRVVFAAAELDRSRAGIEYGAPASRTGIPARRSVGEYAYGHG